MTTLPPPTSTPPAPIDLHALADQLVRVQALLATADNVLIALVARPTVIDPPTIAAAEHATSKAMTLVRDVAATLNTGRPVPPPCGSNF